MTGGDFIFNKLYVNHSTCPTCSVICNGCEGGRFFIKHMTKMNDLEYKEMN